MFIELEAHLLDVFIVDDSNQFYTLDEFFRMVEHTTAEARRAPYENLLHQYKQYQQQTHKIGHIGVFGEWLDPLDFTFFGYEFC
jgi:oligoendopeptidase F